MESLHQDCKREFGSGHPGDFPHCDLHVNTSLSRHIMTFHLALGQLSRCPIPWWSVWKGTAQDCVEHLRLRHHPDSSVVANKMGKCFSPWTVPHVTWTAALSPKVSGITGICPSGPEVCTRYSHSHVCCRYLIRCSCSDPDSAPASDSAAPPLQEVADVHG